VNCAHVNWIRHAAIANTSNVIGQIAAGHFNGP
jgi:hypothetical protein